MNDLYVFPDMLNRYARAVNRGEVKHSGGIPRKRERDESTFHASDSIKCYRMRCFKRAGVKQAPKSPVSLRRFILGDEVEGIVRQAIVWNIETQKEYKGFRYRFQAPAKHDAWQATGSSDVILVHPDEFCILWDVKSCHSRKIDFLKRGEKDLNHFGQTTFYKTGTFPEVLEDLKVKKINRAGVMYVEKETMRTHPEWVPEGFEQRLAEDYGKLLQAWEYFQKTRVMPAQQPFTTERERYPTRKRFYLNKDGSSLIPADYLCDPRYCDFLVGNCPKFAEFYRLYPTPEEE